MKQDKLTTMSGQTYRSFDPHEQTSGDLFTTKSYLTSIHRNYKLLFGGLVLLALFILCGVVVVLVVAFETSQMLHGEQVQLGEAEKQAYQHNDMVRSASIGQPVEQVCHAINCCVEILYYYETGTSTLDYINYYIIILDTIKGT